MELFGTPLAKGASHGNASLLRRHRSAQTRESMSSLSRGEAVAGAGAGAGAGVDKGDGVADGVDGILYSPDAVELRGAVLGEGAGVGGEGEGGPREGRRSALRRVRSVPHQGS